MIDTLLAIAPIFLLIVLGYGLRRGGIPSLEFWNLNDKLVYWVLFPSLLFYKMANTTFSVDLLGSFAVVIYSGLGAAMLFGLASTRLAGINAPMASSVLQGCMRHNTFIALAIAERVFGSEGLALAALVTALLIPVTNVSVVTLMVVLLRGGGRGNVVAAIARDLVRNPLLIAVALGVLANLSDVGTIPVLYEMTNILGVAALPIVLLCVGANIRVRAMVAAVGPTLLSIAGKMVVFPLAVLATATLVGLDQQATLVALIFGAVPTAAGAYTLARQMGGDAPGMAAIVTLQTALSFLTLPASLWLAQHWLAM